MTSSSPQTAHERAHLPRIHQVFVSPSQVQGNHVTIEDPDAHHLATVLRIGVGDTVRIVIVENPPHAHLATILSRTRSALLCELTSSIPAAVSPSPSVTVAQALFQDDFDVALRGLSELGVRKVIPFISDRSVVRPDPARQARRTVRWQEVARLEAALGYHMTYPTVDAIRTFDELRAAEHDATVRIVLDLDVTARPLQECLPDAATSILLVIGPEGGFTEQERSQLDTAGFAVAHLGPRTFRAQYAGIISAALVQDHYSAFSTPPA